MYINPLAMEHGVSSINFDPHKKNKSKIRSVGEKMVIDIGPSWIYQRELARSFRISSVNVTKSSENCGFGKICSRDILNSELIFVHYCHKNALVH